MDGRKGRLSMDTGLGGKLWGESNWKRTCQGQLKNRISEKDKEERPHDAETNPRTT